MGSSHTVKDVMEGERRGMLDYQPGKKNQMKINQNRLVFGTANCSGIASNGPSVASDG